VAVGADVLVGAAAVLQIESRGMLREELSAGPELKCEGSDCREYSMHFYSGPERS
jgi:hypothetical protein